jgi:hypothetical protein
VRFSEDLRRLQELEDSYRQLLADYQAELTKYQTLLEHTPTDPELPARYATVEEKNQKVQTAYAELEQLRRLLSPGSGASSSLA